MLQDLEALRGHAARRLEALAQRVRRAMDGWRDAVKVPRIVLAK